MIEEGLYYLCSETKKLISCAVTAQLICIFVFAFAKTGFLIMWLVEIIVERIMI